MTNNSLLNPKNWFLKGKDKARFWAQRQYSGEQLERILADIEYGSDSTAAKLANADIDFKYKKKTIQEYEKERATILEEPYVTVVKVHMDQAKPSDGFFELDWNEKFVESLIENGYSGESPEMIVKQWFDQVCSNVARENGAIFPDEIEEFTHKRARRTKSLDGKTEIL